MNTLVLNPGSRWLKTAVYTEDGRVLDTQKIAVDDVDAQYNWFVTLKDITKIGIRVVHGGGLASPALFDDRVKKTIQEFAPAAPLHNPVSLEVITRLQKQFKGVPIYCVFDTHFHRTLPIESYTYPIPMDVAEKHRIRRYGFHGIALESVLQQLNKKYDSLGKARPEKVIMAHLGGGTSITAVHKGKSIATTMGMTPLEGPMMITRSGTVDPDIPRILMEQGSYSAEDVSKMLNQKSGFQGLVGNTDTKEIIDEAMVGKQPEALAYGIYVQSIVQQIFAYYGLLQGADALVFSGGIGYRNEYIRPTILKWTGIICLDETNTHTFQADDDRVIFDEIQAI